MTVKVQESKAAVVSTDKKLNGDVTLSRLAAVVLLKPEPSKKTSSIVRTIHVSMLFVFLR